MQLAILMGMDASIPIKAATQLSDYEESMYDVTLSIDKSIDRNTDLRSLDLQTRTLRDALTVQKMAWLHAHVYRQLQLDIIVQRQCVA